MKQIAHGAEAILYKDGNKIIKDRVSKPYRIPELDLKLRKERTRSEAKIIRTLERAGLPVPAVLKEDNKNMVLELEFLDGEKVRDYLDKTKDLETQAKPDLAAHNETEDFIRVCRQIGELTAKMHAANIAHGDLTTSNLILKNKKVFLIDFGLSAFSDRIEDKAVDLHLLKECLVSKHNSIWEKCWKSFSEGYKDKPVLARLKVVESRGRYKHAD